MKVRYLLVILGLIIIGIGFIFVHSSSGKVVTYYASSRMDNQSNVSSLKLNSAQWETFKDTLYKYKVDIRQIKYLDSGENKLVQFNYIKVDKDFPYGIITSTIGKDGNSAVCITEQFLLTIGFSTLALALMWEYLEHEE